MSLPSFLLLRLLAITKVFHSATSQWFANLDHIKEDALNALEKVTFFPESCMSFLRYSVECSDVDSFF